MRLVGGDYGIPGPSAVDVLVPRVGRSPASWSMSRPKPSNQHVQRYRSAIQMRLTQTATRSDPVMTKHHALARRLRDWTTIPWTTTGLRDKVVQSWPNPARTPDPFHRYLTAGVTFGRTGPIKRAARTEASCGALHPPGSTQREPTGGRLPGRGSWRENRRARRNYATRHRYTARY